MSNGFLGYPASPMLDVVVCALAAIVPTLAYSLYVVKVQRNFLLHKRLQVALGLVLLVAVGLFEVDMRWQGGIGAILAKRERPLSLEERAHFDGILAIHLCFAISTVFLWGATLGLALRRMPLPPGPSPHSRLHKRLGWLSAADITLTAVTGLLVYYYGFVVP